MRRKLILFMRGRYGSTGLDKLNLFLLLAGLALSVAGAFLRGHLAVFVLIGIQWATFGYFVFRFMSRNFYARQKENAAFCSVFNKIKNFFKLQYDRIKDIKKYRYRKCPHCKATLRLPVRKGKHSVKCPRCSERFNVRNLF